jgi:putative Mg2+ transporter-C (MgtC) family protein
MGAALFVIIGDMVVQRYTGPAGFDPVHIMSSVITGIGFMGAGVIIFRDTSVVGLTTASGLWVAAGIGLAAGFGLFKLSFLATFLALFVFVVLWRVEHMIKTFSVDKPGAA